jgi:hypothetical protein
MTTKIDTAAADELRAQAQAARDHIWMDETAALLQAMTSGNWELAKTRYGAGEHLRAEAERQLVRATEDVLEALDRLARTMARTREQLALYGPALMLNSLGVIQGEGARVDAAVGRHSACLEMLKAVIFIKDGPSAEQA